MENQFATGGLKSPTDYRDIGIASISIPKEYPPSFFNDISQLPILNQRKIGACVGHAFAKYKQFLDWKDTGQVILLSPKFLYSYAKAVDGYSGEGTYPRLVAKILVDTGCATEATCPNDTTLTHAEYIKEVSPEAKAEAYKAKTSGFAFVDLTTNGIRQAICEFGGFAMLTRLGTEWFNGQLPVKAPKEVISGHETWAYGYQNVGEDMKIYFVNSWTKNWGENGCGYFMWSDYKKFIDEGVIITDIPNHILEEAKNLPAILKHDFKIPMRLGESSEEIKWLQRALKQVGFYNYSITGFYGPITRAAVFIFQKEFCNLSWYEKNILRGTIAGPKTLLALNKIINE